MAQDTSTHTDGRDSTGERGSDVSSKTREAVVDAATAATDKVQAAAHAAVDTVNQNRGAAARVLATTASTIHDGATRLPKGELVSRLATATADQIDATANYVRERSVEEMMADLKLLIRRRPGASMLIAAALGVIVGRGMRNR
jgi:hypothetical protein